MCINLSVDNDRPGMKPSGASYPHVAISLSSFELENLTQGVNIEMFLFLAAGISNTVSLDNYKIPGACQLSCTERQLQR